MFLLWWIRSVAQTSSLVSCSDPMHRSCGWITSPLRLQSRAQTQCIAAAGGLHHRYACSLVPRPNASQLRVDYITATLAVSCPDPMHRSCGWITSPLRLQSRAQTQCIAAAGRCTAAMHWDWARDDLKLKSTSNFLTVTV